MTGRETDDELAEVITFEAAQLLPVLRARGYKHPRELAKELAPYEPEDEDDTEA